MAHTTPKDRIVTAALRVAVAERGGLDGQRSTEEIERAHAILDTEIVDYAAEYLDASDEEQ